MRSHSGLAAFGAAASTAVFLVALVVLSPDTLRADERAPGATAPIWIEPDDGPRAPASTRPARPAPKLDDYDVIATLDAVHVALSEVGDGGTYVWHRRDGTMSGTARPTSSFKGRNGEPCRHLVVTLQSRDVTRSAEGVACRLTNGRWQLDG
ncbi:MAG TPA: RT0821/Lpp0805 family surface protein [Hyphomicrobiaceae bacterium]|nr:RT0821/Lpp0805 family surface protein [Hyphomicrobiaceae bacterium]